MNGTFHFPEARWQQITAAFPMWVLGYVDYIDIFERRHRAGYARRYVHGQANHLIFETKDGYNYDIEINEDGTPKNA